MRSTTTVAAAVGASTAMKATTIATVEAVTPSMEAFATPEAAAVETFTAMEVAAPETASAVKLTAFAAETLSTPATITVESTAAIIPSAAVKPVEPWSSTDENTTFKIVRSVIAVRGTCIRRIIVISIGASGRWAYVSRSAVTRPDANSNSPPDLRVRTPRNHHAKPDQHRIF